MSRKTEQEFMEDGFSAEELAALNGTGDDAGTTTVDLPTDTGTQEAVGGELECHAFAKKPRDLNGINGDGRRATRPSGRKPHPRTALSSRR